MTRRTELKNDLAILNVYIQETRGKEQLAYIKLRNKLAIEMAAL